MALLPSQLYVINQIDGLVHICDEVGTSMMCVDPSSPDAIAKFQKKIYDSELSDEDKCFAHFWSGYFYAHAGQTD